MRRAPLIAALAGFAAGLVAALAVVAIAASSGSFDGTNTIVTTGAATVQPVDVTGEQPHFDAGAIYRARIAGVVTIASVFPTGEAGGSGFVVSKDGLVLTNAHVVTDSAEGNVDPQNVKPAEHVYVRFADDDQVEAQIVGYDLFADVAVLRVKDANERLRPVPLGNSSDVRVGQPVAAIGSPFLEAGSLSVGVVSAINRSLESGTGFAIPGAIQTDAAINHGNSGGPLFDADGRVIGINAQIQSTSGGGEGVGFAVPIDLAQRSMQQLVENGHVSLRLDGRAPEHDHAGHRRPLRAVRATGRAGGGGDRRRPGRRCRAADRRRRLTVPGHLDPARRRRDRVGRRAPRLELRSVHPAGGHRFARAGACT